MKQVILIWELGYFCGIFGNDFVTCYVDVWDEYEKYRGFNECNFQLMLEISLEVVKYLPKIFVN